MEAASAASGAVLWAREGDFADAALTSVLSPDGTLLALGFDRGRGAIWDAATGEARGGFRVTAPVKKAARFGSNSREWVERIVWSADGRHLGAAAGRTAVVVAAGGGGGDVTARAESPTGSVTGLAFNGAAPARRLLHTQRIQMFK